MYPYVMEVRQTVTGWTTPPRKPEFKKGDHVEIYSGLYEGHNFWIKRVRWNSNSQKFQYEYFGHWYNEDVIVAA